MDELRVILMLLGLLLIGGLVLYYRNESRVSMILSRIKDWLARRREEAAADELEQLSAPFDESEPLGLRAANPDPGDVEGIGPIRAIPDAEPVAGETLIIALNVMARAPQRFHGLDILGALRETGFVFGEMNIFHFRPEGTADSRPLCSVANTVEPGRFDIEHMAELETPGLSLFMQLPGPLEGRVAFDRVLQLGRALAERLGGELCDESRSVLTLQTIGHLKENIESFRFRQKMASLRQHRSPGS